MSFVLIPYVQSFRLDGTNCLWNMFTWSAYIATQRQYTWCQQGFAQINF